MKISIIKEDNTVVIDGIGYDNLDISSVENNIHAIQFDTEISKGHIEYVDDTSNTEITNLSDYQSIIDAHVSRKNDEDTKAQKEKDDLEEYKKTYAFKRFAEYPSIEDQLDDLYHNGIDGWKTTIKAIKDKHPKE